VGVLALLAWTANAVAATTTIGQLAPNPYEYSGYEYVYHPPAATCEAAQDVAGTGTSYAVPSGGTTITAWRTNATTGSGQQMTFKVFRKVGDPATYEVVGHDGPRTLTAGTATGGTVNAFTGLSIPVQPGDLVGLYPDNAATVHDACIFPFASGSYLFRSGSLEDSGSGAFSSASGQRPNLTATVTVTSGGGGPELHTLTVLHGGAGYGTVQSSPGGIDACSAECSHAFEDGTVVNLTATPDGYSNFDGWSGGACTGTGSCQLTIGADVSVTAGFSAKGYSYEYGYGGYGPSQTGSPGSTPVRRRCRKAGRRTRHHKRARRHCAAKTKRVAKRVQNQALGAPVLATMAGRTLYSLSAEHGKTFICTGACLATWHPLLLRAGLRPIGPVKLGTVRRPEGRIQITYHGRPVYTFSGDSGPGQANGQGFKDVGTWGAVTIPLGS
jgi:predicted lipoprotein with Yx(FWY)xxD motif